MGRAKKTPSRKKPQSTTIADRRFNLVDLRLIGCNVAVRDASGKVPPDSIQQKINVKTSKIEVDGQPRIACVIAASLNAICSRSIALSEDSPFVLEATFGLQYAFETLDGIPDSEIQEFGQRAATFHVWPYFREFFQSMTTRMGFPPLTLPLLRPDGLEFTPDEPSEQSNLPIRSQLANKSLIKKR